MQLVTVGLLSHKLAMPPPMSAELPLNVQLITVGLLISLYMPPPPP
jgi:hypothetical protein